MIKVAVPVLLFLVAFESARLLLSDSSATTPMAVAPPYPASTGGHVSGGVTAPIVHVSAGISAPVAHVGPMPTTAAATPSPSQNVAPVTVVQVSPTTDITGLSVTAAPGPYGEVFVSIRVSTDGTGAVDVGASITGTGGYDPYAPAGAGQTTVSGQEQYTVIDALPYSAPSCDPGMYQSAAVVRATAAVVGGAAAHATASADLSSGGQCGGRGGRGQFAR
jgi:hypothetical protein